MKRNEIFRMRLSKGLKNKIREAAKNNEMTMTQFIESLLLNRLNQNSIQA